MIGHGFSTQTTGIPVQRFHMQPVLEPLRTKQNQHALLALALASVFVPTQATRAKSRGQTANRSGTVPPLLASNWQRGARLSGTAPATNGGGVTEARALDRKWRE